MGTPALSAVSSELERIFALGLQAASTESRRALLERECGANAELISELEQLFAATEVRGDFLDTGVFRPLVMRSSAENEPVWTLAKADSPGTSVREGASRFLQDENSTFTGAMIGRYRRFRVLGDGGMGSVWLAQLDEPFAPKVAIKVLSTAKQSPEFIARFEAERMTLARLNHPGIARILDGGVDTDGSPYFVMEYVQGSSLIKYCNENTLSLSARWRLFQDVCRAIQYAHRQRVIHRDLKPSNILVQDVDGRPTPRIIDFGVSLSLESERAVATEAEHLITGTLMYMAPEQARFGASVDARSDIYSLGCILFELLAGQRFRSHTQLRQLTRDKALEFVVNQQPLYASQVADAVQFGVLNGDLRGEPDWIAVKCLQNEPDQRYDSVKELLDDIDRYLQGRPILAAPKSWLYPLRKLAHRHQLIAGAALIAILAITAGFITGAIGLVKARTALQAEKVAAEQFRQERDRANKLREEAVLNAQIANEQRQIAQLTTDFLQNDLLLQADPSHRAERRFSPTVVWQPGPNPTAAQLLDRAARRLETETVAREISDRPLVYGELLSTLGMSYVGIGEFARAVPILQRAVETQRPLLTADDISLLETRSRLARALLGSGKAADAATMSGEVALSRERILGHSHKDTLASKILQGWALQNAGKADQALKIFDDIAARLEAEFGPTSLLTLAMQNNRAVALQQLGRTQEGLELIRSVVNRRREVIGADHPDTLYSETNLAGMLSEDGQLPEAIAIFEDVTERFRTQYPSDHPVLLTCLNNLAMAYDRSGRTTDAIQVLRGVVSAKETKLSIDHPSVLLSVSNLALSLQAAGEIEEAMALFDRARTGFHSALTAEHPLCLASDTNWGSCLRDAGRHEEAITVLTESLEKKTAVQGVDHPSSVYTLSQLGMALQAAAKSTEALEKLQAAFDKQSTALGRDHQDTLATQLWLARALHSVGRSTESISQLADLLERETRRVGVSHRMTQLIAAEKSRIENESGSIKH